ENDCEGWSAIYGNAVKEVSHNNNTNFINSGTGSLEVSVVMDNTHTEGEAGKVFAPLVIDLRAQIIHIYLYLPEKSKGDTSNPARANGIQFFLKDNNGGAYYCGYKSIGSSVPTDVWFDLTVDTRNKESWYQNNDPDLSSISQMGIQIKREAQSEFNGNFVFYIDDFGLENTE
ncbi:MAG TPA: hypothetical protein VKS21_06920, partial [Spirochaetota bacterium]|nr:hypothetical protein [Spirochaetota bacterium]